MRALIRGALALDTLRSQHTVRSTRRAEIERVRAFAGNPDRYIREVLGRTVTPQQERVLEAVAARDRVLVASANNVGKTWILAAIGLYTYHVIGSLPDPENESREQGARIILMGPSYEQVLRVTLGEMARHAELAEQHGYPVPGVRLASKWQVRAGWDVSVIAPAKSTKVTVAHAASGVHANVVVCLIDEGQGVDAATWRAAEGSASGAGNKIISPFNPTEASGQGWLRAQRPEWTTLYLSALDHPNVAGRLHDGDAGYVRGAIAYGVIDERVRAWCTHMGRYPDVQPDANEGDFVYALPAPGAAERGSRQDGYAGHPDGELRVYRPSAQFQGQVLGQFPTAADSAMFPIALLNAAMERYRARAAAGMLPRELPDRVGLDVATTGADNAVATPAWGNDGEALLRTWATALQDRDEWLLERLQRVHAVLGESRTLRKGTDDVVANAAAEAWPYSPWVVDEAPPGVKTYMGKVLGLEVAGVSFGGVPPEPTPGESYAADMRTALYIRLSMLVKLGLVDIAPNPELVRQLVVMRLLDHPSTRSVLVDGAKESVQAERLIPKDELRRILGRSPDEADSAVLALAPFDNTRGSRPRLAWR